MTEHDDKISAEPNFAKLGAHGLDDIERGQSPADMGLVPLSNLRRRDADHAHSEPVRPFRTCREIRARSRSKAETRASRPCCERCMRRPESGLALGSLEGIDPVVEIVVPKRRGRAVKRVRGRDDGWIAAGSAAIA